jgi:hypothetical protein
MPAVINIDANLALIFIFLSPINLMLQGTRSLYLPVNSAILFATGRQG